jgi:5-methylcytosine-specific restriction endonuclease McrA
MSFKRARCAHCRGKLIQERPSQIVHVECAEGWALALIAKRDREEAKRAKAQQKAERAKDREKKQAFKKIPELIADAQIAFNAFTRERDKDKGCFVCGRPFTSEIGRRLQAGHVRSRGAAGHLRFNEDNCLGECEGCNGPHGAKPHQIKAGAIARIGQDKWGALEADNTPHKWSREELIQIKEAYRKKLKELKAG